MGEKRFGEIFFFNFVFFVVLLHLQGLFYIYLYVSGPLTFFERYCIKICDRHRGEKDRHIFLSFIYTVIY